MLTLVQTFAPLLLVILGIVYTYRAVARHTGGLHWKALVFGPFLSVFVYFVYINLEADLFPQEDNWAPGFLLLGLAILLAVYYVGLALGALLLCIKRWRKR
jgi:uncharacterized membrane protein YozB (DUF420 family)